MQRGFLACGDPEGWAVWSQAGANQIDVLGGTKLPAGIRGSLRTHGGEQLFGFTVGRGKRRQGWGKLTTPWCGADLEQDLGSSPAAAQEQTLSQSKDELAVLPRGGAQQCPRDDHGRLW